MSGRAAKPPPPTVPARTDRACGDANQTSCQQARAIGNAGFSWLPAGRTCPPGRICRLLVEPAAVRDRPFHGDQDDIAGLVREAQDQHLGDHLRDLARREVDDGRHLPADQLVDAIVLDQLGRAALAADLGAEVDQETVGGLAGGGVRRRLDDGADADVDLQEVVEADRSRRFVPRARPRVPAAGQGGRATRSSGRRSPPGPGACRARPGSGSDPPCRRAARH